MKIQPVVVKKVEDSDDDIIEVTELKPPAPPRSAIVKAETKPEYMSPHQIPRDEKPVASWSPNFASLEEVKNKIKAKNLARQDNERKVMPMQQPPPPKNQPQALESLRFDAPMSSHFGSKLFNRDLSYEQQLKVLRENMIEVMATQPDPDKNYEGMRMPNGLKVKLLPHQCYSLKWLRWRENCYPNGSILADDMGLGKTLTILAYLKVNIYYIVNLEILFIILKIKLQKDEKERMRREKERQGEDEDEEDEDEEEEEEDELAALSKERRLKFKKKYAPRGRGGAPERLKTLIVLPASLLHQWQSEISSKFEPHSFKVQVYHEANRKKYAANLDDNDIVFTTYEIVSREIDIIDSKEQPAYTNSQSPLARIKWKRIILDEAHRIKNHTTKANKAVCLMEAKYRIAITGTPIHNSLTDFYSLLKFLRMAPLNEISLWNYVFPKEKSAITEHQKQQSLQRERRYVNIMLIISLNF